MTAIAATTAPFTRRPGAAHQERGRSAVKHIAKAGSQQELLASIFAQATQELGAIAAAYFAPDSSGAVALVDHSLTPSATQSDVWLFDQFCQGAADACRSSETRVGRLPEGPFIIAVPVIIAGAATEALSALFPESAGTIESLTAGLEALVAEVAGWLAEHNRLQAQWSAEASTAILDLAELILSAENFSAAAITLVQSLASHLGCQRVALGWNDASGVCKLTAISDVAEFDRRTELPLALEACLQEAIESNDLTCFPAAEQTAGKSSPANHQLAALTHAERIISANLVTRTGQRLGAVTLVGLPESSDQVSERFLAAAAGTIAACLQSLATHEGPRWLSRMRQLGRRWTVRRRKLVAGAAVLLCAGLLIPLPYRISCQCELQPTTRRFVAAPYEGIFDSSLVKPGELVKRDQVLGRMDGRIVRWDLAGLVADQQRASKSRDVNAATGKIAAAQIDRLEMERLELKRQVVARRVENLDIKSPLDGIVISGDLQRSQGAPVTLGQTLYEVAPLDRMVVEVAIADDEISHVQVGQSVTIRLNAFSDRSWSGQLTQINPRSEVRDNENVFIGEVVLDNPDLSLRPGMKGQVRISTQCHILGWNLLHKPWYALTSWLW